MTPRNNVDSANAVLKLKNTIWAFPYLTVMGLIWGYLAGASSGAIAGLAAAAAISVLLGSATSIFAGTPGGGIDTLSVPTKSTMGVRTQPASDLNIVRYHKLCHQFDDALIKIEEVLAKYPDFAEALLLKAQILWEGFEDGEAARGCLLKILAAEPDKKAVFHRWALNFYEDMTNGERPTVA